jgi:spermidine synthase
VKRAGHLLVAGAAGFVILVLEFSAVRLMAPAFGQSIQVWANVVGVILAALAAGYALGGRLGERSRSGRRLYLVHLGGALWILVTAFVARPVCDALIPKGLPGDGLLPLGFTGSLVASLIFFAPPSLAFAMTTPFLVRLDARQGREGRASGGLWGWGTLGSLAGCFLAPLWLLQVLGTRETLLGTAAVGGLTGLAGLLLTLGGRTDAAPGLVEPPAGTPPRLGRLLRVTALVTGWAVTLLEFGAVRFMSPWFGQSNHVWANVIGLILLALALGAWIGGRWADAALAAGPAGEGGLRGALGVAAVALALAAWCGPSLFEALLPVGRVDSLRVLPVANQGSRAGCLLLFALPMVLLGCTPPFLVRMATRGRHAGRAAGTLFAWTTVGGLLGCFTTSPLLVPLLGSRGVVLLAGTSLGLLGLALRRRRPAGTPGPRRLFLALAVVAVLAPAALFVQQVVVRPPLRVHPGQIAEVESAYQTVRVVRERLPMGAPASSDAIVPVVLADAAEADTVFLRHDEDAETYQSVYVVDPAQRAAWLTGGRYFEHMALGAFFARGKADFPERGRLRVLVLGYAGGTIYRTLRQTYPGDLDVLGVEIDPAVIRVADAHLGHRDLRRKRAGHPGDRLRLVTGEDARTVVNALPDDEQFDLVLVDAYTRTNYVPFQLATVEFFQRVGAHMAPGAWLGVNVLGHGFRGPVARAVARTMDRVYGACWGAPNPAYPGNVILWARPGATHAPQVHARARLHPGLEYAAFAVDRYLVRYDPARDGGVVLTDDRSPSDRLADEELGL